MTRLNLLLLAVAGAAALSACGRRGDLEQPAPLFGSRAAAEREATAPADQRATQTGQQATNPQGGEEEQGEFRRPREDLRDPSQRLDPISRAPIDGGAGNDPFGPPPSTTPR
jgi:predicted small lipoprotein YifL